MALEEVVHYVTNGATDNSRDFQDFLLNLVVKLSRRKVENHAPLLPVSG